MRIAVRKYRENSRKIALACDFRAGALLYFDVNTISQRTASNPSLDFALERIHHSLSSLYCCVHTIFPPHFLRLQVGLHCMYSLTLSWGGGARAVVFSVERRWKEGLESFVHMNFPHFFTLWNDDSSLFWLFFNHPFSLLPRPHCRSTPTNYFPFFYVVSLDVVVVSAECCCWAAGGKVSYSIV